MEESKRIHLTFWLTDVSKVQKDGQLWEMVDETQLEKC